jgi:ribosomal protein S18 acetylase RimI-like enzyme
MPINTYSPDFQTRPITPAEWQENATGKLSTIPGFWEEGGQGKNLTEHGVTAYGAFWREKMVGYVGVRAVTMGIISAPTRAALQRLLMVRRTPSVLAISPTSMAAIEQRPDPLPDTVVAFNLAHALVAERGQGVGTALMDTALNHVGQFATPETPMPAYFTVAASNPAMGLYRRGGFEELTVDGKVYSKQHQYYQPPDESGNFAPPVTTDHVFMGTVVEGPLQ